MQRNLLFEVTPLSGGIPTTIRMATVSSSSTGVQVNGLQWLPIITKRHTRSLGLATSGILDGPSTSSGSLEIVLGAQFSNLQFSALEWTGALGRLFEGIEGDPFSKYVQIYEGSVGSITRKGDRATLELLGAEASLAFDLLSLTYAGTGGIEGPTGIQGNLKQRIFGTCLTVEPTQIDAVNLVYQVHGYGPVDSISAVYDFAQALDPARMVGDYLSYQSLVAVTLADGQWATCKALGLFRLGSTPTAKLSADVTVGTSTVAGVATALFNAAGVPAAKIGSMTPLGTKPWCQVISSQTAIGDALRTMLSGAGCYALADGTGTWQFGDWFARKAATTLSTSGSSFPIVLTVDELAAPPPVWHVRVGYDPCWSVHSETDVSPALSQLSDAQIASTQSAQDAQETADQAAADLLIQTARIASMSNGGILDRSEKAQLVRDFAVETAQQTILQNQDTLTNVLAERTAENTAYQSLKTYLEGLSPPYTDGTQDTIIDPATYQAKWQAYLVSKVALDNALAGKASTTSTWTGVTGDGKPADNATVGAPAGTTVGDRPVADVLSGIDVNVSAILSQGLRQDDLAQVFDARTLVQGQPVGTTFLNFKTDQASVNTSLASTLALIGAKNADGTGFVLNMSSVKAGNATFGDVLAGINTNITNVSNSLGTTNSTVGTLSTNLTNLGSTVGTVSSNVSTLSQAFSSPTGGYAKSLMLVDVNGVVAGQALSSNGQIAQIAWAANRFIMVDPNGGNARTVFAYDGTTVKMPSVEVDTLKVNTAMVPKVVSTSQAFSGNSNFQSLISTTVSLPKDGLICVLGSALQGFPGSNGGWTFKLLINGVAQPSPQGTVPGDSISVNGAKFCAAGTVTVELQWSAVSQVNLSFAQMVIQAFPGTS